MSKFRKMVIGDKTYQYLIGRCFVKIRIGNDSRVVRKEQIGIEYDEKVVITPKMIRFYLEGKTPKPQDCFNTCRCKGGKRIGYKPFEAEIEEKLLMVYWCKDCFEASEQEI